MAKSATNLRFDDEQLTEKKKVRMCASVLEDSNGSIFTDTDEEANV